MKPATEDDRILIRNACCGLQDARDSLVEAGASKRCVDKVRKALKSAEGALRHVNIRIRRGETA